MARLRSGHALKAIGLSLCAFGTFYVLFVTEFPRSLIPEIDLDTVALPSSHDHGHQHNLKHNHEHEKPLHNDMSIIRDIAKVKDLPTFDKTHQSFSKASVILATSIVGQVEGHTIDKAYDSPGFFWAMLPKRDDYIEIIFNKPKFLSHIIIPSGQNGHENDALLDSDLSISAEPFNGRCVNYRQVSSFRDKKIVEHWFKNKELIKCVRLTLSKVRMDDKGNINWLIVSDITLN